MISRFKLETTGGLSEGTPSKKSQWVAKGGWPNGGRYFSRLTELLRQNRIGPLSEEQLIQHK